LTCTDDLKDDNQAKEIIARFHDHVDKSRKALSAIVLEMALREYEMALDNRRTWFCTHSLTVFVMLTLVQLSCNPSLTTKGTKLFAGLSLIKSLRESFDGENYCQALLQSSLLQSVQLGIATLIEPDPEKRDPLITDSDNLSAAEQTLFDKINAQATAFVKKVTLDLHQDITESRELARQEAMLKSFNNKSEIKTATPATAAALADDDFTPRGTMMSLIKQAVKEEYHQVEKKRSPLKGRGGGKTSPPNATTKGRNSNKKTKPEKAPKGKKAPPATPKTSQQPTPKRNQSNGQPRKRQARFNDRKDEGREDSQYGDGSAKQRATISRRQRQQQRHSKKTKR
jgi:hypothetical protein